MLSLCLNLVLCIVSFFPAYFDHGERWLAFKNAKGKEKVSAGLKFFLINWGLPLLAFLIFIVGLSESAASSLKEQSLLQAVANQSNELVTTTFNLDDARRELNSLKTPRTVTREQRKRFLDFLNAHKDVSPVPVSVMQNAVNNETTAYADELHALLVVGGFGGSKTGGTDFSSVTVPPGTSVAVLIHRDVPPPQAAGLLVNALRTAGLKVASIATSDISWLKPGDIGLLVTEKR